VDEKPANRKTNKQNYIKKPKKLSELFDVPKKKSTAIPSQIHKQEGSNVTKTYATKCCDEENRYSLWYIRRRRKKKMLQRAMEEPLRCNRCGKKAHNCKNQRPTLQHFQGGEKKKNHERRETIGNATE
jgi:hypothetical protein